MNSFYYWAARAICIALASLLFYSFPVKGQSGQFSPDSGIRINNLNLQELKLDDSLSIIESLLTDDSASIKVGENYPCIWDEPLNTGLVHGILIWPESVPRLNDINLQMYDYIGGFYQDNQGNYKCGGAYAWDPQYGIILSLFGDDPDTPEKDGFSFGEPIQYRFFLQNTQKEYFVDIVEYKDTLSYVTNGKWYKSSLSIILDMKAEEDMDFYISPSENPVCINKELTLTAEELIGNGGNYTYQWSSDPPGFDYTIPNPPAVLPPLQTTTYLLTVSNGDLISEHELTITVNELPQAFAGEDGGICDNQNYILNGSAQNYSSILWETTGDGSFTDPYQFNTEYAAGTNDKLNDSVNLILIAQPLESCVLNAQDTMTLVLHPSPEVSISETTNICENMSVDLEATGNNIGDIQWSSEGNGTFSNPNSLITTYTPGSYGNSHGSVDLTITVSGISPCNATTSATTTVDINEPAFAYAGTDATICKNEIFQTSASAAYYYTAEWYTNGDGYFEDPNSLNTTYYPGDGDKLNGQVRLTLFVTSIPPCEGSDFDRMYLTINDDPEISLGEDASVCENETVHIVATAANYSSISWETSGDGTFTNTSGSSTDYIPGTFDLTNGNAQITAYADPLPPCTQSADDVMAVYFIPGPNVDAGNDQTICSSNFANLSGFADNYNSISWSTNGDGYFSSQTALDSKYFPGPNDMAAGVVTLSLTASGNPPCDGGIDDNLTLSIQSPAQISAVDDQFICEGEQVQLNASAENHASISWTTNGDGTFSQANILDPVYTPGFEDIANGNVILTVTATSFSPCSGNATANVSVNIQKQVTVAVGNDASICENENFFTEASAENFGSIQWSTGGDGSFADPTSLATAYYPGQVDTDTGQVTLTLDAEPINPCTVSASDGMILQIIKLPTADAGNDQSICQNNFASLSGSASNYASFEWITGGDGYFTNPGSLTTNYSPGENDKTAGNVAISLMASPLSPCSLTAEDQMDIEIDIPPIVNAGQNCTICEGETIQLSGQAQNFSSILWTSSGSGTFSSTTSLNSEYTPSIEDIAAGNINICLTANTQGPCNNENDCINVTIEQNPTAFAGTDTSIPYGSSFLLSEASAENYSSVLWTTTDGTGIFGDPAVLNTTYTPSEDDLNLGFIHLTLSTGPLLPCTVGATDEIELEVTLTCDHAIANAGDDVTICAGENIDLDNATAEHYESITWSTQGDGSFSEANSLNPVYTPGQQDIQNGGTTLCMTAFAYGVCNDATDCMNLSIEQPPTANAGENQTICETAVVNISGIADNYSGVIWSSSGDGTFNDANSLNTSYTPGTTDLANGVFELCLNANGLNVCGDTQDCIVITLQPVPVANAGDDQLVCEGSEINLSGFAENYGMMDWTTSGDGSFSDPFSLNPTYVPGPDDLVNGSVDLCLTAFGEFGCANSNDCMTVSFQDQPVAGAGTDITICENEQASLLGIAENYTDITWSTSGDGSFDDANALNAAYTPGNNDITNGTAELCLTATGLANCDPVQDCMTVTINELPSVNAGQDKTICETSTLNLSASAYNQSSIEWSSNGDGVFTDKSQVITQYIPGDADIANGGVQICITAYGMGTCPDTTDCVDITIDPLPDADAGNDLEICAGEQAALNGSATNAESVYWSTNGDGIFENQESLNTFYYPGQNDIANGFATLQLTAISNGVCDNTSDQLEINIQKQPTADAGPDATIDQGLPFTTVSADASDYTELHWSTSGTGAFLDPNIVNTQYQPSQNDYTSGSVSLTISAMAIDPCSVAASDDMTLAFNITGCLDASADAGTDATICENESFTPSATADNYESLLWESTGDGSFDDPTLLNPVYTPGTEDIETGSTTLCLTAFAEEDCLDDTDCLELSFQKLPFSHAGSDNTIPTYTIYDINDAYAENQDLVQWVTTNGTGSFSNETVINPSYQPGPSDWAQGYVELGLFASPINPCVLSADDFMILSFADQCEDAIVDAGENINACFGETSIQLNASASYFNTLSWSSSGDGAFNYSNTLNPLYTLGSNDIAAGTVTLSLTATAYGECNGATDNVVITLHPDPVAAVGNDLTVCGSDGVPLSGNADNYSTFTWTSSGDGTFQNAGTLNPSYLPGTLDMANGAVEICLEVEGYGQCPSVSDCMTITLFTPPAAEAGDNAGICENQVITLNGTAQNHSSVEWSTTGDGNFSNSSALQTDYAPGPGDIAAGNVQLCLTAFGEGPCPDALDCIDLTIYYLPIVSSGGDLSICETGLAYPTASVEYAGSSEWSTSGDGTFDDPESLTPVYTPGTLDILNNSVTLTITAYSSHNCDPASDDILLNIETAPFVNAGNNTTICETGIFTPAASAANYSTLLWETAGDGTFSNAAKLIPDYTPGPGDVAAGSVQLCLTAFANNLCIDDTSCLTLSIQYEPEAYAGENIEVEIGDTYYLADASAANYSGITWSTNGTGTFGDPAVINTTFYPSQDDYALGSIILTLTAAAIDPCTVHAEDETVMNFVEGCDDAIANAGEDFTACLPGDVQLNGTAQNFTSILWETQGDGTFTTSTDLSTVYVPGNNDLSAGNVDLCLTAFASGDCQDSTDCVTVTFDYFPEVNAGEDVTICETQQEVSLSGAASNYDTFSWSTSGDGFFTGSSTLSPDYHPGIGDIFNGTATITLEAENSSCGSVVDILILSIERTPTVYAGENTTICEGETLNIADAFASNYISIEWTTTGDGTFDNQGNLTTNYQPGPTDILNGGAQLCLIANAFPPCSGAQHCFQLTILPAALVNAGDDLTICENQTAPLNATAENYSTIFWETSGDGTFDDPEILNPVYNPGISDVSTGSVVLSISATSNNNCNDGYDELMLNINYIPEVDAGNETTICENEVLELAGSAGNYTTLEWTTSGDGTFGNPNALNTTYSPGTEDISVGFSEICLTAGNDGSCEDQTDCFTLTITPATTVEAGDDMTICDTENAQLNATAENYSSLLWTSEGDGTFNNPAILNPVYTPGQQDLINGSVLLTLTATGLEGCTDAFDNLMLNIQASPFADAGEAQTICETSAAQLNATAGNYNSLTWSTDGDGTFDNSSVLNPVYTPGSNDIATGSVEVCLTAVANGPCSDHTDCMVITIQPAPTVNAGEDTSICETSSFFVLSGQASFYSGINWQTSGDGTFDDPTLLNAAYYPGTIDLTNGQANLCLQVTAMQGCDDVEDCMTIFFQAAPVAIAGENATICEDQFYEMTGSAQNASSLLWQTNGDGTFDDPALAAAVYTPGQQDIQNGEVELCLTAEGFSNCEAVTDCMQLTIQSQATLFAGDNFSICEDETANLAGSAENYGTISWSTSGDGTFQNPSDLFTQYTPGALDIESGTVNLCLLATGLNGCNDLEDCLVLDIIENPGAYAGEDITLEQGLTFVASEATATNYEQLQWSTSGTGSFNDPGMLAVEYTPSQEDYSAGDIVLTLQALPQNPCNLVATDDIHIEFLITACLDAVADAGEDAAVCTTDPVYQLSGFANHYESLDWTTDGDGTFDQNNIFDPVYTPGETDLVNGSVTLCLTAFASDTCQDATDCMTLTLQHPPYAYAGADNTIPEYELYTLADAYAENFELVQWFTTNGAGSFNNETIVNPTYQPTTVDWQQGYVELSMVTSAISPCTVANEDVMILNFIDECEDAFADAGEDIDLCIWETEVQMDAAAGYYTSLNWSANGDGTFNFPATLNPVYTFGSNDVTNGSVELYLEAQAYDPCNPAYDTVVITLHEEPLANAGPDMTICGDAGFEVNATAENYSSFAWSTSGDGAFLNNNSLNPLYLPGAGDMLEGNVQICLEAQGYGQCIPANDCISVTLVEPPTVDAGENFTICEDGVAELLATAENYSSVLWETNGDGTFDNAESLNPVYSPGSNDMNNGSVEICITAFGLEGCNDISDCLVITIQSNPVADAGIDATIEEDQTHNTADASAQYASGVLWSSSGSGTFDDDNQLATTYFPSDDDITAGLVTLQLTAFAVDPCQLSDEDSMLLSIIETCDDAIANAGEDFTSCLPGNVLLNGYAANDTAVIWETSGDGTFTDPQSLVTEYVPGNDDMANMVVELCLTAFAEDPCADSTDCVTVSFMHSPVAFAGDDIDACNTQAFVSLSGTAENYDNISWSTTGTGNFNSPFSLNTKYFMSYYDYLAGEVHLILTAESNLCGAVNDTLKLSLHKPPLADAGADATICGDTSITLSEATVQDATGVEWTSSGDGSFENPEEINTTYIPGDLDIENGAVELCLTAFAVSPCADATNCMMLTIQPMATVNVGDDISICESMQAQLNATADNFESLLWTTTGDGTFNDQTILNPVYTPGPIDIDDGETKLKLSVTSPEGCGESSDFLMLFIDRIPTALAGNNTTICENETLDISGIASHFTAIEWTSGGDGSFTDQGSLETTYQPGPQDISSGSAEICLTAFSNGQCENATDCFTVLIELAPIAIAGENQTICESDTVLLNGLAENHSGLLWTTSGDGTFDDPAIADATYTPGSLDIQNQSVELTLSATGFNVCPESSDSMIVSIINSPVAEAGPDATICGSESFIMSPTVQNAIGVQWTTTGDGTFEDPEELNTTYTPGNLDIENGIAELCLTAFANLPCSDVIDCMTLTLQPVATVNVGDDISICESMQAQLNATADNFESLMWTTTGDGTFDDQAILNPVYTPGPLDIEDGETKLKLTAISPEGCGEASDFLILEIDQIPAAFAGNDTTICENEILNINGTASQYMFIEWTTGGDGSFADPASLETTYQPGPQDFLNGSAELCLTAFSGGLCENATDCLTILIEPAPVANAGEDITICETVPVLLNGSATNFEALAWTTSGDGTFNDPALPGATYTPGSLDIQNQVAELTLTATGDAACPEASDNMTISIMNSPVANAGENMTVCENESLDLNGWAENYTSIEWTSDGAGFFADSSALQTTYIPLPEDFDNGSVELCLTAYGNDYCEDFTDCMIITLYHSPYVDAGDDIVICETEIANLNAVGEYFDDIIWETSGDGTFDNPGSLSTLYTPGSEDMNNGSATLSITASNQNGCDAYTDEILLTIVQTPEANAGEDMTICSNQTILLEGAVVNAFNTEWTTSGDGTFNDAGSLSAIYTPGAEDIASGNVELCLTAFGDGYCDDHTDCVAVSLTPAPVVEAGPDQTVCEAEEVFLAATAENYSTILWETSGDGTFESQGTLEASYIPGPQDILDQIVSISITTTGLEGCDDVSDNLKLTIERTPVADAGEDTTICANDVLQLNAAASFYSGLEWTTTGDGTFDNPGSLSAAYTPGPEDIGNGGFTLCLTAFAEGACADSTDCIQVIIQESAIVNAGEDVTLCESSVVTLNGQAENYTTINWNTSGDGSFDNPEALQAIYTPGPEDLSEGEITLCLAADSYNNCGFVEDCLTVTFQPQPLVNVGEDQTICENQNAQLSVMAAHFGSLQWETSGDGTFNNPALPNAVYTPGPQDLTDGSTELCLTANGLFGCDPVTDCLTLYYQTLPSAIAGNDTVICVTETLEMQGSAENYDVIEWNTNGDGSFENPGNLATVYIPGQADLDNGSVELCLTAYGISGCENITDCLTLNFQAEPQIFAGDDQSICESDVLQLDAIAENYSVVQWSTAGDGSFSNPSALTGDYSPGPEDIENGQVEICITATGLNGCAENQDCMLLFIEKQPTSYAGDDLTTCAGGDVQLSGTAENFSSLQWSTSGDGSFSDPEALNTTYIPGAEDLQNGGTEICLTAMSEGPCPEFSDCLTLTIQPLPQVNAGEDASICETENIQLNGTAQNYLSVFWTSSGSGGFSNPQTLNPVYIPSDDDIENGSVELCLKANGLNGCGNVTDCLTVMIFEVPEVDAGPDATICDNESIVLSGIAENYASFSWTSEGDGTFEDPSNLNTVYIPGPDDIANQQVEICLEVDGQGNCPDVSDCLLLDIQYGPQVNTGDDHEVCQSGIIPLTAEASNYSSLLWSTNGDGTFTVTSGLETEYIPGAQDIENGLVEVCLTAFGLNSCGETTECVLITFVDEPSAFAGDDATILQGDLFVLDEAEVSSASSYFWSTTGTGTFEDPDELHTDYYPGNADIANGGTTLILTAQPITPCTVADTDSLELTIFITGCLDAEANAGDDLSICSSEELYLEQATAFFYESLLWSTSGDGFFDDNTRLDATYTPGPQDLADGNVLLCLKAFAEGICLDATDCMELSFQPAPVAFAGSDNTIPKYESYQLNAAYAEHYNMIQWITTNGAGNFSDENILNPVYQPASSDWMQGYVELTLIASPINPCAVAAEDEMVLSFTDDCMNAVVDIETDTLLICNFEGIIDVYATGSHYSSVTWSTAGDGTFNYPNMLSPKYTLGPNDKIIGEVMLYITAEGFAPCSPAIDSVLLTPQYIPEVYAGADQTICEGNSALLDEAEAMYYEWLEWTTSGDGTFSDPQSLITEYEPGSQDLQSGIVELTLTAESYPPCQIQVSASMILTIDKLPEIIHNIEDQQVPVGTNVEFFVAATDGKNYQWYNQDGMIPGADDPVFLIPDVTLDDAGSYHCVVYNDCGSVTSNTAQLLVYEHQIVEIDEGWTGLSSWIEPYNLSVTNVFSDVVNELYVVKNFGGMYFPGYGINTLLLWDPQDGYEAKFRNAVSIEFKGLTNDNKQVELSSGWNYLAVISECPVEIADVFGGNPHVQIIKEIAGNGVYWPINAINTIGELIPGKAYLLRASQAFTATYPECSQTKGGVAGKSVLRPENETSWNDIHYTPASHVIALDENLKQQIGHGMFIGAFTNEERCAGMLEITSASHAMTIYGDDPLTEQKDGFGENEPIRFKVYDPETGRENMLNVIFNNSYPDNNGLFVTNGLSGIIAEGASSVFDGASFTPVNIYPNPTEGMINITGLKQNTRIEVYTTDGQLLLRNNFNPAEAGNETIQLNLEAYPGGVLYLRIMNEKQTLIEKIILK